MYLSLSTLSVMSLSFCSNILMIIDDSAQLLYVTLTSMIGFY
jgi:hypothetical protein